jgi:hypothetical protein
MFGSDVGWNYAHIVTWNMYYDYLWSTMSANHEVSHGDFNGDGYQDIAIGLNGGDNGGGGPGQINWLSNLAYPAAPPGFYATLYSANTSGNSNGRVLILYGGPFGLQVNRSTGGTSLNYGANGVPAFG